MRSLRSRLIVGLLAGVTVLLAASGTSIYVLVRARLQSDADRSLEALLRAIASTAVYEIGRSEVEGRPGNEVDLSLPPGRTDLAFELRVEDGTLIDRSLVLAAVELPQLDAELDEPVFDWVRVGAAQRRTIAMRFIGRPEGVRRRGPPRGPARRPGLSRDTPGFDARDRASGRPTDRPGGGRRPPPIVELYLVQDLEELDATLERLRWLLVLAWFATSLGCAAILGWGVPRGLRPVDRLRARIEELDEASLDQRIAVADVPAELEPFVDQLNAALTRLAEAFEREQAFTSHAAHELRTPLAGLRATLEVALGRERSTTEYRDAAERSLAIAAEMQTMVDGLLDLARLGGAGVPLQIDDVDLGEAVAVAWDNVREAAAQRGMMLEAQLDGAVRTDRRFLARVLDNLLQNAVAYGDAGTPVRVEVRTAASAVVCTVTNHVAAPPPDLEQRAFDAFWRGDVSRTEAARHAGLGLALCKRIVELLGGSIAVASSDGRVAVTFRLPVDPDQRSTNTG